MAYPGQPWGGDGPLLVETKLLTAPGSTVLFDAAGRRASWAGIHIFSRTGQDIVFEYDADGVPTWTWLWTATAEPGGGEGVFAPEGHYLSDPWDRLSQQPLMTREVRVTAGDAGPASVGFFYTLA